MEDSYQSSDQSPLFKVKEQLPDDMFSSKFLFILITATGIGVFMGALDGSIINVSLQPMGAFFKVSQGVISWVAIIYLIIMTSFTAIAGKIGDKYSNKLVFQVGMLIFTIGSLMSSLSTTFSILIISRIIQAIGSTGLTANGIAIITRFTTSKNRGTAIGWNSIFVAMALTLGPILGGILTSRFGWQTIFMINIPIGIIGLIYVQFAIPPTPPKDIGKKIDLIGSGLFGFGLILLIGGPSLISIMSVPAPTDTVIIYVIGAVISCLLGIIVLIIFYFTSKRKNDPIIDLSLFSDHTFVIGIITAALVYGVMEMIIFQLPFLVININNFSDEQAGFVLLGIPLAMALVGPISGRLSDKYDPKYLTTIGTGVLILAMIGFALVTNATFNWFLIIPLTFFLGASVAIFSSPNGNSIMSSVPKNRIGMVGGFIGIARTLGFSMGIAVSAMLMVLFQPFFIQLYGGSTTSASNYIPTYQTMVLFGALFAIICIFITYKTPKMIRAD